MHQSFIADEQPAGDGRSAKPPSRFGVGPTAFLVAPRLSCRASVILLCMFAVGTQLVMRSVPFVATVGPDGMAAEYDWDEHEVGQVYASFGWGYCLSQIPGSMLSIRECQRCV